MENYPSNADGQKRDYREPAEKEHEKLGPVIGGGSAKTRKKSTLKKIVTRFIGDEDADLKEYLTDMAIDAVKRWVSDSVDTALFGSSREHGGSDRSRGGGSRVSFNNYRGYSDDSRFDRDRRDREERRGRAGFKYEDIVFDNRGDAEVVLRAMDEAIDRYKVVSIFDMFDLAGLDAPYTYMSYGWTDIRSAHVERSRTGEYMIVMPRALPIK